MKVISAKEMYTLDKNTCEKLNISSFDLMNKAASAMNEYLKKTIASNHKVIVIAGKGNNGGDAIILHQLLQKYTSSSLYVFSGPNQSTDNKLALSNTDYGTSIQQLSNEIEGATHVIDGLFGIGFKGELNEYSKITKLINTSNSFIYSIDIPSGINGNNGVASKDAVIADETLVIEHLKYGNILQDALDFSKKNTVIPIGIMDTNQNSNMIEKPYLEKRKHNSHKYNYGSVFVIGGSEGMYGAPILSSLAALKSGAGLVHMSILSKYYKFLENAPLEVMIQKHKNAEDIKKNLFKKSAVVFGMGLGKNDSENIDICNSLITDTIPTVIDADGLFYLRNSLDKVSNNIIITPHFGELSMLLDIPIDKIQNDPIKYIKLITENEHITVVLKGPTTIIANKDKLIFSSLGSPGMATAGAGDVLAGIIARFLQDDPLSAAVKGVYIHSLAAREAIKTTGEESMIATDIIHQIQTIIKRLQS